MIFGWLSELKTKTKHPWLHVYFCIDYRDILGSLLQLLCKQDRSKTDHRNDWSFNYLLLVLIIPTNLACKTDRSDDELLF